MPFLDPNIPSPSYFLADDAPGPAHFLPDDAPSPAHFLPEVRKPWREIRTIAPALPCSSGSVPFVVR